MAWYDFVDILSVKPQLFIDGKNRYHNIFGAILTIFSYISVLLFAIYIFLQWIDGYGVNIVYLSKKNPVYTDTSFSLIETPIMWSLVYNLSIPVDPSYFSMKPFQTIFVEGERKNMTELKYESCDKFENFNKEIIIKSLDFELKDYNCVKGFFDDTPFYVSTNSSEKSFTTLLLRVSTCKNSTSSKIICKSSEEINDFILNNYIEYSLVTPSYTLDHFNINFPILPTITQDRFFLDYEKCLQRNEYINSVKYSDDRGYFTESKNEYVVYIKDDSNKLRLTETNVRNGNYAYHTVAITGENEDFYKRTYPKIQNILANIGSIASLLINISTVLSNQISGQMFNVFMGNFMFDLNYDQEKVSISKNKSDIKNSFKNYNTKEKKYEFENKIKSKITNKTKDYDNKPNNMKTELTNKIKPDYTRRNSSININNLITEPDNISLNKEIMKTNDVLNKGFDDKVFAYHLRVLTNKISSKLKIRSLSLFDAICCIKFSINKRIVDPCGLAFRYKFSCDNIISVLTEYENFKKVVLDEDERYFFKFVKLPSIFEFKIDKFENKNNFDLEEFRTILYRNIDRNDRTKKILNSI